MDHLKRGHGPLADKLGVVFHSMTDTSAEATMPVEGNTQPYGLLHGGMNGFLVEHLASGLAMRHCPPDLAPVGTDLHVSHVAPATADSVRAVATLQSKSKGSIWVRVEIFSGERLTAFGSLTLRFVTPRI